MCVHSRQIGCQPGREGVGAGRLSRSVAAQQRDDAATRQPSAEPAMVADQAAKPIGTALNEWGKKDGDRLAFEDSEAYIKETYNVAPRMYAADPTPTPAEKAEMKKPAFVKANQEFKAAEPAIRHEVFVLLTEINKGK